MRRNPLYVFRGMGDVGIYDVPLHSTIHILDAGNVEPKFVEIIAKVGLGPASTIGEFLLITEDYIDMSKDITIPSELEKLVRTDGKIGWRIFERDETFYGTIGENAVDFSVSEILNSSSNPMGAMGRNSFAVGENAQAQSLDTVAIGQGTLATVIGSTALGRFNTPTQNAVLTVGNGDSRFAISRKNALEIYKDGSIISPTMTTSNINTEGTGKILITREYLEDPAFGFIPMHQKGTTNGVVPLDNHPTAPKIPSEYLPAIAVTEVNVVDYISDMVALNAQVGDVCIVTKYDPDGTAGSLPMGSASFIHNGGIHNNPTDWTELQDYNQVWSVNGKTGVVVLNTGDLADMDISGINAGELIEWDGNKWVPISKNSLGKQNFIELSDTPTTYGAQGGMIMTIDEPNSEVVFTNVIDGGTFVNSTVPLP